MKSYDFDKEVQNQFNKLFSGLTTLDWRKWLKISSKEEYESQALKNSGLDQIDDIYKRIKNEKTQSRSFSVNITSYIRDYLGRDPLVFVHTSGTTNSSLSGIKWFHMKKSTVSQLWAPGMRAIFESSGLDNRSSAVIFVPSRINIDGINILKDKKYISLYSSEFSQRIMISIIKPLSYLLYEYKHSKHLDIISKILSLNKISVVSAPAATILGWANLEKFKEGLKMSLADLPKEHNPILISLLELINKEGFDSASEKIQSLLSEKISKAVLIFSISSLTQSNWDLIRKFMQWENGMELFTNLYVASEIGPFASSLGDYKVAGSNKMFIFPLTLPVIEYKGKFSLLSQSKNKIGNLYVSRQTEASPLINIETGDVISIKNQVGLPQIGGDIFRSSFILNYPIKISHKVVLPRDYRICVGDLFTLKEFEILAPRYLLDCLLKYCKFEIDALLLVKHDNNIIPWKLVLSLNTNSKCRTKQDLIKKIENCPKAKYIFNALNNNFLELEFIEDQPIDFLATRSQILSKVRNGIIPKGILKKWPLYLITPEKDCNKIC
ncbi:MAG: hypothetical protein ACFFAO_06090 [Candidatus Hermodarchaeota archaeon]